jgi:hypothetical protein
MTTELKDRPNLLKTDADGNWYSIPAKEVDSFTLAVEEIQNADFMSSAWHDACNDLKNRFGGYLREDL